jgi:hypothetical protein
MLYRVEFVDPAGGRREASLEAAEFYVAPREIGEEVQVTFAAGPSPRIKGPARARNAAFIEHVPWVIVLGIAYLIGQALLSLLPAVLRPVARAMAGSTSRSAIRDPDRPELH